MNAGHASSRYLGFGIIALYDTLGLVSSTTYLSAMSPGTPLGGSGGLVPDDDDIGTAKTASPSS
jgi:hypothetical protein